jgi:hypothetical protein
VGVFDGAWVGTVGAAEGAADGTRVVGDCVGAPVGEVEGADVGLAVGVLVASVYITGKYTPVSVGGTSAQYWVSS